MYYFISRTILNQFKNLTSSISLYRLKNIGFKVFFLLFILTALRQVFVMISVKQPSIVSKLNYISRRELTCHVSSRDTSAPCSPRRLSLATVLVRRGFIKKDTSVCRLICVAIWRPYSTTNDGEVSALQRTTKSAGLRLSALTIKFN